MDRRIALVVLLSACSTHGAQQWRFASPPPAVIKPHAMAVADHPASSQVGAEIMRRGGNAIDAIVATAFAHAAVSPIAGNIGGGGFLVYRQADGEVFALDFREKAPLAATPTMFLDANGEVIEIASLVGPKASGVPGAVAGLWAMHQRFGQLPWHDLVAPAVALAQAHVLDTTRARWLNGSARSFEQFPASRGAFVRPDRPWTAGDTLRQPDLARTLQLIADSGASVFYTGQVAQLFARAMQESGGLITLEDLAQYKAEWRTPLRSTYRGYTLFTMPPVSGGGATMIEILNILERFQLPKAGSAGLVHLEVEAMRRAFLDRNTWLGDPAFVTMPLEKMISKEWAAQQASSILPDRATPLEGSMLAEGNHTTHYSVLDSAGNAAALTTTLNTGFGSKFVVAGAGFLLNNEMDDFTAKPGAVNAMGIRHMGEQNTIQPGKRMLSSMTPTIVLGPDGKPYLVLGSEGGAQIIAAVTQVISNVIDHGMTLAQAQAWPRVSHNGLPDRVGWEPNGLSPAVRDSLAAMGYTLWKEPEFFATVNAIRVTPRGIEGVPDPRVPGGASGF